MKYTTPISLDLDDLDFIMTPKVKKNLFELFEDDGNGMEDTIFGNADGLTDLNFNGRLKLEDIDNKFQIRKPKSETNARRDLFSGKRRFEEITNTTSRKFKKIENKQMRKAASFETKTSNQPRSPTKRTEPEVKDDVRDAVNRLIEEENLTGDGRNSFCLPTVNGKHQDLKAITPQTMADVLSGRYDDVIGSCRVIDCRYPYEYDGGHIRGAENLFTQERVLELLQCQSNRSTNHKRDILVFHCEFSSERGPKMIRYLRAQDRELNKHRYPILNFPEIYLLEGGYKDFYETNDNKSLCEPMEYKPMLHKEHTEDLRHFRSKSKSWTAGEKKRNAIRLRF